MAGADYFLKAMQLYNQGQQQEADNEYRDKRLSQQDRQFNQGHDLANRQLSSLDRHRTDVRDQSRQRLNMTTDSYNRELNKQNEIQNNNVGMVETAEETKELTAQYQQAMRDELKQINASFKPGGKGSFNSVFFGETIPPDTSSVARGREGKTTGVNWQASEDASQLFLTTTDKETGEELPLTVDPSDNNSTPLFIPRKYAAEVIATVGGMREMLEDKGDEEGLIEFATNQGYLVAREDGSVVPQSAMDREQAGQNEQQGQGPLPDQGPPQAEQSAPEQGPEMGGLLGNEDFRAIPDRVSSAAKRTVGWAEAGAEAVSSPMRFVANSIAKGLVGEEYLSSLQNPVEHQADESAAPKPGSPANSKAPKEQKMSEKVAQDKGMTKNELRTIASVFDSPQSRAIAMTRPARLKQAKVMAKYGLADAGALDNYIETGTMISKAALEDAGLDRKSKLAKLSRDQADAVIAWNKANEAGKDGWKESKVLKSISSMLDTSVKSFYEGKHSQGGKGTTQRVNADLGRFQAQFLNLLRAGNHDPSKFGGPDGAILARAVAEMDDALRRGNDSGYSMENSLGPALDMALTPAFSGDMESASKLFKTVVEGSALSGDSVAELSAAATELADNGVPVKEILAELERLINE